jgi:hypothetical protein
MPTWGSASRLPEGHLGCSPRGSQLHGGRFFGCRSCYPDWKTDARAIMLPRAGGFDYNR